ncbi:glycosyl transferase family 2 [Halosimplex carlsbadense 2-9-1]|uniref:Glycosyl transferase family 2 n=1 Tax=Halosimplex carlsbadense 2-9-1 TaxID=797114 RepID=M0CLS2_9EURY|nr:glycosyltransferase [Halosimplex carlsbadense]ELZ24225.1 glycosyl transferase family 2 [Halosimplex carlsbadense 2-9-1]
MTERLGDGGGLRGDGGAAIETGDGESDAGSRPTVTVVVVTYNSVPTVAETLASLTGQTYPSDRYEVVVVDGGSTDGTADVAADYGVEFLVEEGAGIGACRNRGIDRAESDYVAFTDSDCAVPATWLDSLVDRMATYADDERVVGVGGPNRPFPTDSAFTKLVGSFQGTAFGSGGSPQSHDIDRERLVRSVAACNVLYDAEIFERFRYDDSVNVGEDAELHFRLSEAGYRFAFDPTIAVSHHLSPSLRALWAKNRSYGTAMARIQRRHGKLVRWYSFVPTAAIGSGGAALAADLVTRRARYVPLLAALFLVASGYAALQVYRDRGTLLAALVPVVFAVQYLAYGVGFAEGLTVDDP